MKRYIVPILTAGLILLGLVISARAIWGDKQLKFREEVQLHSGEIIEIDRKITMRPFGEVGGPGGADAVDNSLAVVDSASRLSVPAWRSDAGLVPMLLDQEPVTNEWFIVATFYSCEAWYRLGRPKLPYAEFRLRNGQWQQVELTRALIGRKANVLVRIRNSTELARHTIATKAERNDDPRIEPSYTSIVGKWSTAC